MTASVLWTITILNYNHALENLRTMNDFYFTKFVSDRMMGRSTEGSDKFHKLQHFNFARFQLIEDYGNCTLRKDLTVAPFVEQFKTATL